MMSTTSSVRTGAATTTTTRRMIWIVTLVWACCWGQNNGGLFVSAQGETNETDTTVDITTAPPTETPDIWGGCVDMNKPEAKVTIGDPTTICLTLADGTDWGAKRSYMRLNFKPKADEYSRFHVPESFKQLVVDDDTELFSGKNISVHVSSQNAISFQRRYYDGFKKVYPHLTAILDVQDGVVKGISWDDACIFCGKNACAENTFGFDGFMGTQDDFRQPTKGCFIDQATCQELDTNGKTDCDLVLYVVWTGTDSKGLALQSSSYRFSAFPAQELADRFSQNVPDVPDNVPFSGN